jgi:hypothetical protein
MRFVKLAVRNFQALETADVEFGRGLNVLYGPNDLGKSTFACAIRAVLLVPPYSSEAGRYKPWFADAVPEVSLIFVDDDDRFWRIKKSFGGSAALSSAELHHSKDGVTFTRDCGGREVDEKLREKLGWGIPSPGGKGAPKRLPTSFLAHVLVAEQSDVETIFEESTEEDGATSGRDRLRKALSALAEDPTFKKILLAAQKEVDALFTPTGQRKRGRGSRFAIAAEDIKRRAERVDALKKIVAESSATEEHVRRLQDECAAAREASDDAGSAFAEVRRRYARTIDRSHAAEKLAEAKRALAALEKQKSDIDEKTRTIVELERSVAAAERALGDAQTQRKTADAAERGAEEALRAATSKDGLRQRELAHAKLAEERAVLGEKLGHAEKQRVEIEAAQKAIEAAESATRASEDAKLVAGRARESVVAAERELQEAESDLALAAGVLAYGDWHAAEAAGRQADELSAAVEVARSDADAKQAEAEECEALATKMEIDAKARTLRLPDGTLAARIGDLKQEIAVAEAALGGGFSVALHGTGKVPVHVVLDGRDAIAGTAVDGRLVLEAERAATLRVGDLLDVEIVAGAAEKRRALEALRQRWTNEAQPVLERAGVTTVVQLRTVMGEVTELVAKVEAARRGAKQLRTEAETARESTATKTQRIEELLAHARQVETLEQRFVALDRAVLAAELAKLGAVWKQRTGALVDAKEKTVRLAREKVEKATRAREMDVYRATEAEKLAEATATEAERARGSLVGLGNAEDSAALGAVRRTLADIRSGIEILTSRRAAIDEELRTLDREASTAVTAAKAGVEDAKGNQERAVGREDEATKALATARSVFDSARGELEAVRKAFAMVDRAAVESRVAQAQTELDLYAGDPPVSKEELATAENRETQAKVALDALRSELNQAEGALTKVGGVGVREELSREEEAFALAKERQRELELDADAWKLLQETLDVVEEEGSTHLGRSLAAPVSARIVELTRGRYSALRLDQHLRAERVDLPLMANVDNVLEELSAGTRGQFAALLRLSIAEQLKSAIILDDHLVHTDPDRLAWFRSTLRTAALNAQVIVITCRPGDYLAATELPAEAAIRDLAGGAVRAIDFARSAKRFESAQSRRSSASPEARSDGEVLT